MQREDLLNSAASEAPPRVNEAKRFFKVFLGRPLVVFGLVIILVCIIMAIFAPQIAPYDPIKRNLSEALQQPNAKHISR